MEDKVRKYEPSDLEAVIALAQTDFSTPRGGISSLLDGADAFVYDDGSIKGVALATQPRDDNGVLTSRVRVFTHPGQRRLGIAARLWQEIAQRVDESGAQRVGTSYLCDRGDGQQFFKDRGFVPWFQLHELAYTGPAFPEPDIEALHYEDRFFADYLRLINDGFTGHRRDNNIEPNVIFGPESFSNDKLRQDMLDNRDNLWVFLVDGELMGLLELEGGPEGNALDTLGVKSSLRGRGYGRAITQFGTNRMRERGVEKVWIGVLGTNVAARRLYESLGYVHEQSLEMARLWLRVTGDATPNG